MLLPRAAPIAQLSVETICDVAIRINSYGYGIALGAAFLSAGTALYAVSGCLKATKVKEA